jgi:hypothetical protein
MTPSFPVMKLCKPRSVSHTSLLPLPRYPKSLIHFTWHLQIKSGYDEGKDILLTVMSAMGEEQICAVKEIGGKN